MTLDDVTLCITECRDTSMKEAVYAMKRSMERVQFKSVKFFTSCEYRNNDVDVIRISPIRGRTAYSTFCKNELYKHVNTSHILIIQHDGYILNNKAWDNKWLEVDYIGSVWYQWRGLYRVGNGGFSLRSRRLMEITAELNMPSYPNEDVQICRIFRRLLESRYKIKFATEKMASTFAIEGSEQKPALWSGQFGFHSQKGMRTFIPPDYTLSNGLQYKFK